MFEGFYVEEHVELYITNIDFSHCKWPFLTIFGVFLGPVALGIVSYGVIIGAYDSLNISKHV